MSKRILVMDAHAVGMLGVIRSLGRAGYSVTACATSARALGLHSHYAEDVAVHPPYASGNFANWLDDYISERRVDMIVPSEGFLHAVRDRYERFVPLLPDAVPQDVWEGCMSKVDSDAILRAHPDGACNLPFSAVLTGAHELAGLELSLQSVASPFYVKGDVGKALGGTGNAVVRRCLSIPEALDAVAELLPNYQSVICQGHAPGRKVGVSLWRHRGEFRAESMTLGIHMNPFHGGMMSLRETFWHQSLLEDAKRKMELLGWEGVAMMEYKWDPDSDRFWFIEINARYWGYLHLDLYAGKDFPCLQADAFFGSTRSALGPPTSGIRCRYLFPADIGHVLSLLKSEETGWSGRFRAILGFIFWSLNLRCHADLWFPRDRALYWRAAFDFFRR